MRAGYPSQLFSSRLYRQRLPDRASRQGNQRKCRTTPTLLAPGLRLRSRKEEGLDPSERPLLASPKY